MEDKGQEIIISKAEPTSLREMEAVAQRFTASNMFSDAKNKAVAFVKIKAGQELGLPAFQSMTEIFMIKGKPTLSANIKAALLKKAGYTYKLVWDKQEACAITLFTKNGQELGTETFSIEDAKKAGVFNSNPNWTKYPRNMLFARCISNVVRWHAPEVATGFYDPEEMTSAYNVDPVEPSTVEIVDAVEIVDSVDAVEIQEEQKPSQERIIAYKRIHAILNDLGMNRDRIKRIMGYESLKDCPVDVINNASNLLCCKNLEDLKIVWKECDTDSRRILENLKEQIKSSLATG